jgi:hypothetical protein
MVSGNAAEATVPVPVTVLTLTVPPVVPVGEAVSTRFRVVALA